MNHYGYPTPPASPVYDGSKCYPQPRCIPLAPEERLGRILEDRLRLTEILGTGAYGVVYSAIDINNGIRYAVKCLSRFNPDGSPLEHRQVAYQQREIRLHYLASAHSNVVSMHKIVNHPDCIYVILEFCPEGDLFLNITERGQYVGKDELAKKIFLQILDAVEHCHNLGIYHRDLKPENILVTDQGQTAKLADFGLATSDDRSEDYGCGSTFYMSPECLDPNTRKPYYMCAPNDIWSLGVILVNLTCGRNPWKQASFQDSTYRAYAQSQDFLKTILPLSDDLNDILGRVFHPNPELRITLPELRNRILACSHLTVPVMGMAAPSPSVNPEEQIEYVYDDEEAIEFEYEAPLSPASSVSDDDSLTCSGSTISDDDEDFIQEQRDEIVAQDFSPILYEPEAPRDHQQAIYHNQEFVPQYYTGPAPVPVMVPQQQPMACLPHHPVPSALHAPCPPKPYHPWDVLKYVQQIPIMQPPSPFHHQVPVLHSF